MADQSKYVFKSIEAASEAGPPVKDDRHRLYQVIRRSGESLYVWERNPTMARGRASEAWGDLADEHGRRPDPTRIALDLRMLTREERIAFLRDHPEEIALLYDAAVAGGVGLPVPCAAATAEAKKKRK